VNHGQLLLKGGTFASDFSNKLFAWITRELHDYINRLAGLRMLQFWR